MRFAFKTSPQNTTWDSTCSRCGGRPTTSTCSSPAGPSTTSTRLCLRPHRPLPRGLDHADRAGAGDPAAADGRAGHRHPLPPPGGAGEHGGHARRRVRRPAGARHRRRLERGGVRRLRHRAGPPAERIDRFDEALRGAHRAALAAGDDHVRGRVLPADARRAASRSPCSGRTRRSCIGGSGEKRTLRTAARFAQHWNFDGGTPEQFTRARDVLHRHCADIGRDPAEILVSSQVRFTGDPADTAATAAALGARGAELAIVYLPTPYTPGVLEPLASALAELS